LARRAIAARPEVRRDDGPQRESPASRRRSRAYPSAVASWHDEAGYQARIANVEGQGLGIDDRMAIITAGQFLTPARGKDESAPTPPG